ncbi:hypothetical protein [Halomontanus rarus]|nr:hypothetical protein [Halovivax sp. TS33]
MASKAKRPCPNCGTEDVWLEEQARRLEYGCNLCNHQWAVGKAT